jgi:hypothetical protein
MFLGSRGYIVHILHKCFSFYQITLAKHRNNVGTPHCVSYSRPYSWQSHLTQAPRSRGRRRKDEQGSVSWKYSSFTVNHVIYRLNTLHNTLNFLGDANRLHKLLGQSKTETIICKNATRKTNGSRWYVEEKHAVSNGPQGQMHLDGLEGTKSCVQKREQNTNIKVDNTILQHPVPMSRSGFLICFFLLRAASVVAQSKKM